MKLEKEAAIVTVANINQWGNKARIASRATVIDGLLDVVIVAPFKTIEIPLMALRLMLGKIDKCKGVTMLRGGNIIIEREMEGPVQTDGDPAKHTAKLEIQVNPSSIAVLVPKDAAI